MDLNKKKIKVYGTTILIAFFILYSSMHFMLYNDRSIKLVESVLFRDEGFIKEYGVVEKYSINRLSQGVKQDFGVVPFTYEVSVIAEKKNGTILIYILDYGDSPGSKYKTKMNALKKYKPIFMYRTRS